MNLFFQSLLLILAGGIAAPLIYRRFALMKWVSVSATAFGCIIGLVDAVGRLLSSGHDKISFAYLNFFSLSFKIDGLSSFFLIAVFAISCLAAVYSFHYMNRPERPFRVSVNYLFFSLLVVSMGLVAASDNMITFMISWEIMSLSSFFLVIYDYESKENRKAGYIYFVFSHAGALFILAAFGIIYGYSGSLGFEGAASIPAAAQICAFIFAFIGFGSKAGVFPFHVWLPYAHPAAPSHISAVMSGVMIKTGIYGILRIYLLIGSKNPLFGEIVLIVGVLSGIMGVLYALGQNDVKRFLAYSSIENMGIILIGVGVGMIGVSLGRPGMALFGFAGGMLHVLNHALFKSLLFMGAGMAISKAGTRSIDLLGGLFKKMKITGSAFLVGSLAISGLPPFNGFVGEFFIYFGSFKGIGLSGESYIWSFFAIVSLAVIGGLALACFTKVFGIVFQGEPRSPMPEDLNEKGPSMLASMLIATALCLVIGVFPKAFLLMTLKGMAPLDIAYPGDMAEPFIRMTGNITRGCSIFFAVFLSVLVLRFLLYRKKRVESSHTWGCGFTKPTVKMQYTGSSYSASILRFFRPVAPFREDHPAIQGRFPNRTSYLSHIDDIAEIFTIRGIVNPVLSLFDKLRWIQHGDIHLYIGYILLAIVVLLFFV